MTGAGQVTAAWVRAAHGDAWQAIGAARAGHGGGAVELPGVRLSATGLPHPQWNNGDVDDVTLVDLRRVSGWYARLGVPWGLRVPAGCPWTHGRRLFTKRLMGLTVGRFAAPPAVPRLSIRPADPTDLPAVLPVDALAFEEDQEVERPWLAVLLQHPSTTVAVAERDDRIVGTGYVVRCEGRAGTSGYVGGIAVLPDARRQGIGAAITGWLVDQSRPADLWHLHPNTEPAAAIYRRLGFIEVDGLDIYVGVSGD